MEITKHGTVTISKKDGKDYLSVQGFEAGNIPEDYDENKAIAEMSYQALIWARYVIDQTILPKGKNANT